MDQIDLNIGIPFLIQDQNETVIYMEKFNENQSLVEDEPGIFIKNEPFLINSASVKDSTISRNIIENEPFVTSQAEVLTEKSKSEIEILRENRADVMFDNNNLKSLKESETYFNGEMVELADGTAAFIENSNNVKNEVYTPVRLYNGNMIYVVSETLSNNDSDSINSCESEDKTNETVTISTEQKQEKNKGFQCSYKNCNKSYTSFHHLKVSMLTHLIIEEA